MGAQRNEKAGNCKMKKVVVGPLVFIYAKERSQFFQGDWAFDRLAYSNSIHLFVGHLHD